MSIVGSTRGGVAGHLPPDPRYDSHTRYYPGTYIEDYPASTIVQTRAYRTYAGRDNRRDGYNYHTTRQPFQPDYDYYHKEYKRPYYYRDNRLFYSRDRVLKEYDGSGNVSITVLDPESSGHRREGREVARYRPRDDTQSVHKGYTRREKHEEREDRVEREVGLMVEHLASFDVGESDDTQTAGANIECAIETLRNMDQDGAILPLRCYLTYKEDEIQVLSDKELTALEWIKFDDVCLVSAEVHQLDCHDQILLIQDKKVIHLFCPVGNNLADDLARQIKDRISNRRDQFDCQKSTQWEKDTTNNRYLLNDNSIKEENDIDFYDKYAMQLYGCATRDYVARNEKEVTIMRGERVQIQSTRGQWWSARTANGNTGYVPADCLESYVPSPAGLPRTNIGEQWLGREMKSVSERGSVVSVTPYKGANREYQGGRRDGRRDNDRGYDRDQRRDNDRGYDRDQQKDNYNRGYVAAEQGPTGANNANQGFGTVGQTVGNNLGTTGLDLYGVQNMGISASDLGPGAAGVAIGLTTNGLGLTTNSLGLPANSLGNTLGTGGLNGVQTVTNPLASGLFPPGFTAHLQAQSQNRPALGATNLGNPTLGNPALGGSNISGLNLGTPGLGGPTLDAQGLGGRTVASPGLGVQTLGVQGLVAQGLGVQTLGAQGLGGLTLGSPGLGAQPLGAQGIGGLTLGSPGLGAQPLGAQGLGGLTFGSPGLGAQTLGAQGFGGLSLGAGLGVPTSGAQGLGVGGLTYGAPGQLQTGRF